MKTTWPKACHRILRAIKTKFNEKKKIGVVKHTPEPAGTDPAGKAAKLLRQGFAGNRLRQTVANSSDAQGLHFHNLEEKPCPWALRRPGPEQLLGICLGADLNSQCFQNPTYSARLTQPLVFRREYLIGRVRWHPKWGRLDTQERGTSLSPQIRWRNSRQ